MAKILGLDYGSKRIGLAVADEELRLATPFGIIENKDFAFVADTLHKIVHEEEAEKIIIGLPVSLAGESGGKIMGTVKEFIDYLKNELEIEIITEDERFTSEQVNSMMRGFETKYDRDAIAAMLILQSYLDRRHLNI